MRAQSIERQVLSPWMDIAGDDLEPAQASEWCRLQNDTVADDLNARPRFSALAALPVVSGEDAAAELVRAVRELGFVGGAVPTQVKGLDLDESGLDPLFESAVKLGAPLFVHPYRVMAGNRMDKHFLSNVCGNPFETTLAAMRLYFGGILDARPGLKVLLAHAGGVLPILAGRAAHASRHSPGFDRQVRSPDEILSAFYYDTLLHDPRALSFAFESIGPSRMAAGTDAPFPMQVDHPIGHIQTACAQAGLDSAGCKQILEGTAIELFGL
jgi:aminocarboxymuconate-semialdehyde decarboxylase